MNKESSIWLAEKMMKLKQDGEVRFAVHIKPGKRTSEHLGVNDDDELMVNIAAQPVENEANLALISYIATLFSVSKYTVVIVSGAIHRKKILKIVAHNS